MDFVSRSLTYVDYQGEQRFITDAELAALPRSLIILGEPGMGKSRLLAELARADGTILRTAASFVNHPDPAELAAGGRTLIIDGLDEVSAVRDTDPINRVVAQLIRAKLPRFVLSCRVADWRGAVAREEISQEYAPAPMELLLQPLSPGAAESILAQRIAPDHAAEIVMELRRRDLEDLYGNPLTITLLAEVVASAGEIPRDRITLLQKACALMWRESNDRHQGSALSNMTEPEALDAAGAAFAALILSGRQAISTQPSLAHDPVVIPASEIRRLHDRLDVQAVIGSRLFSPLDLEAGRFRSVHRSVAEYLGARWIAQGLTTDIARDRFLEGITVDEGVPASLRGLHAWLPHFDDRFAARVIATDPYGVLRYGNADHLSLKNGRRLLAALRELQESNPFFRAEDWTRHSAAGLTQEPLREDLRNLLVADDTGFHLRTLLLEAIRGSTLAGELVDDLLAITLTADRSRYSFAERQDAAEVILALQSPTLDWASITFQLVALGDQDSTRLALLIHKRLGYAGIAPEQVAVTVLAQLGLLESVGADASRERAVHANLYVVERHLPDELIPAFLDELSRQLPHPRNDTGLEGRSELCDLVRKLVARTINHQPPDPLRLLAWLKLTAGHRGYTREAADSIQAYLTQHDSERRDIQRQALFFDRDGPHLFGRSWRMTELNQGLGLTNGDIAHFLRELGSESLPADEPESVWEELVTLARSRDGLPAEVEAAARPFTASRPPMVAKLAELALAPPRPDWEIENEEAAAEREREREDAWTKHRNEFAEGIDDVRAGELRWILPISQAYLGLFSDSDRALAPVKRIAQWLGPELAEAGLEGLEATLHRPDLPALEQVARDYAGSQRWNFVIPLIAAFNERVVSGRGIDDLPIDLVMLTAVALEHEIIDDRLDVPPLKAIIAARLRSEEGQYERYLRFLVEPSLTARREHIQGLYQLVRGRSDRDLVSRLPGEWLTAHPDLPLSVEDEFLDVLAVAGERDALRGLYRSHAGGPFHSDAHRWTWEAVGFLADFGEASRTTTHLPESEKSMLWHIRSLLHGGAIDERSVVDVSIAQRAWIVTAFRRLWPDVQRPEGVTSGDTNAWDASAFLRGVIARMASDPSEEASTAFRTLLAEPEDSYTPSLKYSAFQQRNARRETSFTGLSIERLEAILRSAPPASTADVTAIVRYGLGRLQAELRGSDTDGIDKYYTSNGEPQTEDWCTDRLIEDLRHFLNPFGIAATPQRDMPAGKRADIVFSHGDYGLPVECKGQWNLKLWSAAEDQLAAFYLPDWRAADRGIYLVYWFGLDASENRALRGPPAGGPRPRSAEDLQRLLTDRVAPERRANIVIEALDLSR